MNYKKLLGNQKVHRIYLQEKFSFEWLSKYRNPLMGIQIILIIFFHFTEDCMGADVHFSGIIYLFYKYIRSSGVDIFLLLSGLGLYYSWKRNPDCKKFYQKRFTRLLIPYFIVAVPAWIYWDIFVVEKGILDVLSDISFVSFFTEGVKWFWYIIMAAICYLIFPYIFEIVDSGKDRIDRQLRIVMICFFSHIITMSLQIYDKGLYDNISVLLTRFPAFFVGVWLGKLAYERKTIPVWKVVMVVVLSIVLAWPLQMVEKPILRVYSSGLLNLALCLVVVLFLERLLNFQKQSITQGVKVSLDILEWFGKYTIELYLIHVMVRRFMKDMGLPLYYYMNEIKLIVISMVLALILKKLTAVVNGVVCCKNM